MKIIFLLLLTLVVSQENKEIRTLTDENFKEVKEQHDYVLVYFHATYSQESNHLQLHFRRLPDYINSRADIAYGIMTQKNYVTNHKYDIESPYPKIVLVQKDNFYIYKGEMSTARIADWVDK